MRGHLSRVRAISSWTVAGTLTLVLSTTAVALMSHTAQDRAPLSEPVAARTTPTVPTPGPEPVANEAPTTVAPVPPVTTPVPTTVTYSYSYGGDDGSSDAQSSASSAYGDD